VLIETVDQIIPPPPEDVNEEEEGENNTNYYNNDDNNNNNQDNNYGDEYEDEYDLGGNNKIKNSSNENQKIDLLSDTAYGDDNNNFLGNKEEGEDLSDLF
jgi:hypothetical protein